MKLKISRILHAGYVFECEGVQIAFDTIFENPFSRNCHAFPAVGFDVERIKALRLAAVFISHFHDDHCSLDSLNLLDKATPIYIYCLYEELFAMVRELGFSQVLPLKIDETVRVGPFEIIPRWALDEDVDSIFHIRAAGLNVLNVVDSWIGPDTLDQLAELAPWDMVLWPFQTMREIEVLSPTRACAAPATLPEEWLEQLALLDPRYVVPSSCQFVQEPWSWYNHAFFPITYGQFQEEVEAALPRARVLRMNPSLSFELERDSLRAAAPLDWVLPLGEQDVDYAYDAGKAAPPTAAIARRFAPLTAAQSERVWDYCRHGMLERYAELEAPCEGYFERARVWRLSVYDHAGAGRHFRYRLDGERMTALADDDGALSWSTELPLAKLYAALESGESLTSMYVRINAARFDAASEAEIATADIVDDPLIRCLFNVEFGAYQAAQLKRIKEAS